MQVQANSVPSPVLGPTDSIRPLSFGDGSFGTVLASSMSASCRSASSASAASGSGAKAVAQPTQDHSAPITITPNSDSAPGTRVEPRPAFKFRSKSSAGGSLGPGTRHSALRASAQPAAQPLPNSASKTNDQTTINPTLVAGAKPPLSVPLTIAPVPAGLGAPRASTASSFTQPIANPGDENAVSTSQISAPPAVLQAGSLAIGSKPLTTGTSVPPTGNQFGNFANTPKGFTVSNVLTGPADAASTLSSSKLSQGQPSSPGAGALPASFTVPASGKLTSPAPQETGSAATASKFEAPRTSAQSINSSPQFPVAPRSTFPNPQSSSPAKDASPVQSAKIYPTESTQAAAPESSLQVEPAVIPATLTSARPQTFSVAPSSLITDKPAVTATVHIEAAPAQSMMPDPAPVVAAPKLAPPLTNLTASPSSMSGDPAVATDKTVVAARVQTSSPTPGVSNLQVPTSADKEASSALHNSQPSITPSATATPAQSVEAIRLGKFFSDEFPPTPSTFTRTEPGATPPAPPATTKAPQTSTGDVSRTFISGTPADPQPATFHWSEPGGGNSKGTDLKTADPSIGSGVIEAQAKSPATVNVGAQAAAADAAPTSGPALADAAPSPFDFSNGG